MHAITPKWLAALGLAICLALPAVAQARDFERGNDGLRGAPGPDILEAGYRDHDRGHGRHDRGKGHRGKGYGKHRGRGYRDGHRYHGHRGKGYRRYYHPRSTWRHYGHRHHRHHRRHDHHGRWELRFHLGGHH